MPSATGGGKPAANALPYIMLTDWLQECLAVSADGKKKTASLAADRIKGTWLVFDVPVVYDAETQEPAADVLLPVGESLVEVDLPLPEAFRRGAADDRPMRVIVGRRWRGFNFRPRTTPPAAWSSSRIPPSCGRTTRPTGR